MVCNLWRGRRGHQVIVWALKGIEGALKGQGIEGTDEVTTTPNGLSVGRGLVVTPTPDTLRAESPLPLVLFARTPSLALLMPTTPTPPGVGAVFSPVTPAVYDGLATIRPALRRKRNKSSGVVVKTRSDLLEMAYPHSSGCVRQCAGSRPAPCRRPIEPMRPNLVRSC
jgi:hypothetical protein